MALFPRAHIPVPRTPSSFNSNVTRTAASIPLSANKPIITPTSQRVQSGVPGVQLHKPTTNLPIKEGHNSELARHWDAWPDGVIKRDFTWQEYEATGKLMSHWSAKVGGGDRRGKPSAAVWEMGKRSTRDCLGVIQCDNEECTYAVRPFTTRPRIARQLENNCEICGASLTHRECNVRAVLWKWSGGVHYKQTEIHGHLRPPRILHLSKTERQKFVELVEQHPKTGPRGLIVGVPGLGGPGQSTADISPALLNIDRVAKERQKVKRDHNSTNGDDFIASFAKFITEHAEFVLSEVFGPVTVIALQSPFMASQLVHGEKLDQPINGLVNDAAHGWWKERNYLLMITSVYSPELACWIPGLMSFTNGSSADHFKWHFLALFESIAEEAESREMAICDELFAGVSYSV